MVVPTRPLRANTGRCGVTYDFAWRPPANPGSHCLPCVVLTIGCVIAVTLGWNAEEIADPAYLTLLSVVLIQPLLEELIFRGYLLSRLLPPHPAQHDQARAVVLQALAFSLLHVVHHPVIWAAMILVPGLIFGWIRVRYGSVIPAVGLHVAFNAAYWLPGMWR